MKLGIITKHTDVAQAIWLALPSICRWALLAAGRRPETVTLGDLR